MITHIDNRPLKYTVFEPLYAAQNADLWGGRPLSFSEISFEYLISPNTINSIKEAIRANAPRRPIVIK